MKIKKKELDKIMFNETKKIIMESIGEGGFDIFEISADGVPVEYCENENEIEEKLANYRTENPNKNFIAEKKKISSKEELLDKLDAMGEELEVNEKNMENDVENCSECEDMAEEKKLCEKCNKEVCECDNMKNESVKTKKKLRLTENQLIKLINKMVNESVKGLEVTKKAQNASKKENDDYASEVKKKMDDYLDFDGNDKPEFPKQVGSGEKEAYKNTSEQEKEIEEDRGYGMEDLKYDFEPSDKFKDRQKKALVGDTTMGNPQKDTGNTTISDIGEKILKKVERKKKKDAKAPQYAKDAQPVKNVNESESMDTEMNKIKNLYSYNKKTQ